MSTVTIFVARKLKNPSVASEFAPTLEALLNKVTGQSHVSATISESPDCTPDICLALYDFGGFGDEKAAEIKREVRKLTRQHFGISDKDISVTLNATLVL